MMSGIRGKNTRPEMLIRKGLHARGFRYRLHDRTLPGRPDMVFGNRSAVIFVNGCFWHGHHCHLFKWPSSRAEFWRQKILRNREKDEETIRALSMNGWRILTIWECALKGRTRLPVDDVIAKAAEWLCGSDGYSEIAGFRDKSDDGTKYFARTDTVCVEASGRS